MRGATDRLVWRTSRRTFDLSEGPLIMAVINATPDSFSDGGFYHAFEAAIAGAEKALEEGADIIDIGGESTRPGAERVSEEEETRRVLPLVEDLAKRFDAAISVDTTKRAVAEKVLNAGAEIINDISGLRFEPGLAEEVAKHSAGVVLMHSRGSFEVMHTQEPVDDIIAEVASGLEASITGAREAGVADENICLDVGIGFGKTAAQNFELIANLDAVIDRFEGFPMLVGASRKSFIGAALGNKPPGQRLYGTLAVHSAAILRGANIVRVHDVGPHKDAVSVIRELVRNAHIDRK